MHGRQRSDDQLLNFSLGVLVVLLPVTDPFLHSPFAIVWDLPVGVEVIANGRAGQAGELDANGESTIEHSTEETGVVMQGAIGVADVDVTAGRQL